MSEIAKLSYESGGELTITLVDPETGQQEEVAVDVSGDYFDLTNLLAVDAAFERRAGLEISVDDHHHFVRVMSLPAPEHPVPRPRAGSKITRISTQQGADRPFAEIFIFDAQADQEKFTRTEDPVTHLLCHGAYTSAQRAKLTLDDADITRIVKHWG